MTFSPAIVQTSGRVRKPRNRCNQRKHKSWVKDLMKGLYVRSKGAKKEISPQIAIELSASQWTRLQPFALVVELVDVRYDKGGRFFCPVWRDKEEGSEWSQARDSGASSNPRAVVTEVSSIERYSTLFTGRRKHNIKIVGEGGSGIILLIVWNRQRELNVCRTHLPYKQENLNKMKRYKDNSVKFQNKHHGSNGLYFSFGVCRGQGKGARNIANPLCTVVPHALLKPKYKPRHKDFILSCRRQALHHMRVAQANIEAAFFDAKGASVVKTGSIVAEALLRSLCRSSQRLRKTFPLNGQAWYPAAVICHGASTSIAHTEMDITYTMIHCPQQERLGYRLDSGTTFNFYLRGVADDESCLKIPLNEGTSVFFSGFLMMHRQECINDSFVNLAFYGNRNLYNFGCLSLERLVKGPKFQPKKWRRKGRKWATKKLQRRHRQFHNPSITKG
jgi:hypothetical protein